MRLQGLYFGRWSHAWPLAAASVPHKGPELMRATSVDDAGNLTPPTEPSAARRDQVEAVA